MARVQLSKEYFKVAAAVDKDRVWSDEQDAIFHWFEEGSNHLVIRARAGTGKTTTLIEGINRAPERRILLAAFNKAIADELSARITNHDARAQTLHALGLFFCKRNIPSCRNQPFKIDTKGERARALAAQAANALIDGRKEYKATPHEIGVIAGLHTKIREILIDPYAPFRDLKITQAEVKITTEAYLEIIEMCTEFALGFGFEGDEDSFWSTERIVDAALRAVELARQPTTTIDFADMIFLPLVHNWVKPVCDLLVVDEAQDLSEAQLRLAIAATRKEGRICICGDDRQAVYAFRGADSGSLDRLKAELGAAELGLKTTYRCPQEVVALAQKFVPDFYVAPTAPRGDVLSLLGDKPFASAEPGDFVLSRTNADLISVCLELIGSGKKAYVKGSEFARDVRKLLDDLITNQPYLKLSLPALATALEKWYESECEKSKKLKKGVALKKLGCVTERRNLLAVFIKGSENYRDLRVKIEATFVDTPDPEAIMCATVHKAKGLEAPNVFLLGNTFSRESSEEENICYVAMTRAKEILYIVGRTKGSFVLGGRISRDDVSLE